MNARVKNLAILLFLAFFAIYAAYETRALFYGLWVEIDYPPDGATLERSTVFIDGRVNSASFITLNGRKIYTDERGHFREEFILAPGLNILTLEAEDRFGKMARDIHRVVVNPNAILSY